ncbi:cupin domain-containing protein [Enterococcus diestrammenae]|uniref:acetate kinase n=1 Tax=Enterococcus diestrammenae TaxID=1155073 RepID=UPI00195EB59E
MPGTPQSYHLADLLDYHEGQIASRSLKKRFGTKLPITLLALAQGETISAEESPLIKIIQVLEGQLEVTSETDSWLLNAGDCLPLPVNYRHSLKAVTNCKILQTENEPNH